ncbi:amidase signature enzyme [Sistotremastrum niveocremeum HHB9708]|uniref:Glutamyl-tRNA(Gln) amidotransferase subunit A, mitochondrial n=2 Tax=Sistotremastraceae TaxID=3402574 RepID=A0A164VV73_9AGAM|nr:amidase signature enzyme [Sistotremastrum niveocremeum HHB9708]KZT43165.1 amidase signature enzyme [Sistotremastrum suecicum HHB10207 ss-3]
MRSLLRENVRLLEKAKTARFFGTLTSSRHGSVNNSEINAFVSVNDNLANSARGRRVAIKDNICTKDFLTTCSSSILRTFDPGYDATLASLLKSRGWNIIGKTNCDEFGMGSLNVYSSHGPVINPWNPSERRSAGGSSGGSAAAVAAGLCEAAIGTDTGGSTRLPAAYCGIIGFKPSHGLISRWGVVSYADSLDCVGIFGKDAEIVSEVFEVLNVHDPQDPTSANSQVRERMQSQFVASKVSNMSEKSFWSTVRVGIPLEYFPHELDPSLLKSYKNVLRLLLQRGAQLVPISLPNTKYALSAYYALSSAEASSNMARYNGKLHGKLYPLLRYQIRILRVAVGEPASESSTRHRTPIDQYAANRTAGFGPEVQRRVLLGTYTLTADAFDNYFLQAMRVRSLVQQDFSSVFKMADLRESSEDNIGDSGVDFILHLSAIRSAPQLSETGQPGSEIDSYVQDVMTVPASLAGLPAASIPSGLADDDWPVGVSIVGQWGSDHLLLKACKELTALLSVASNK